MQQYDKLLTASLVILLPSIIYLLSFSTLVYNESFYNKLFAKTNADIAKSQLLTKELFEYFRSSNFSAPAIKMLDRNENMHIQDVKHVIRNSFYFFYAVLSLFFIGLFFVKQKQKVFFYGGIASVILPILLILLSFSSIFTIFHQIFFPQGNWMFPADSALVNTYTFEFFKMFAMQILITGEFISATVLISSILALYVRTPKNF